MRLPSCRLLFVAGFLLGFGLHDIQAQPYIVQAQRISLEQGLPNRTILSIGQDRAGYIWLGGLNDAYRFDGRTFVPLPLLSQASLHPLARVFSTICRDAAGNMWFLNKAKSGELAVIILEDGQTQPVSYAAKFKRPFPFDVASLTLATRTSRSASEPSLRYVGIHGHPEAVWLYAGQGQFRRLYSLPGNERIQTLYETPAGTVLVSAFDTLTHRCSLLELAASGHLLRRVPIPASTQPIHVDAQGIIYLNRLWSLNTSERDRPRMESHRVDSFLFQLRPDGTLTSLPILFAGSPFPVDAQYNYLHIVGTYDPQHQLFWFSGQHVLFAWSPERGMVFNQATAGPPFTDPQDFISVFIDRTGAIWAGAADGIFLITLETNPFRRLLYHVNKVSQTVHLTTRGIGQFGQELWVNANDMYRIDLRTGREQLVKGLVGPERINTFGLYPTLSAADSTFWAASRSLIHLNPRTGATEHYDLPTTEYAYALWQDGQHRLWIGTDRGITQFDPITSKSRLFTGYNQFPELAENRVNGFFPDKPAGPAPAMVHRSDSDRSSRIWVAASSGLYLLDTLRGLVARYSMEQKAPYHLPFSHITFVYPDPDQPGQYWLATRGGGLIRWERRTGQYQQFTQATGLPNNNLYCIYTDHPAPRQRLHPDRLWITTDYGLVSFDKKTHQLQTFLPKDGITHEEFNLTSHYQASDGQLYLGGLNGITTFQPRAVSTEGAQKSSVLVTRFQQLDGATGKLVNTSADYKPGQPIRLPANCRAFELSFALLDYRYLNQTRLWYRIVGWQDAWSEQNSLDLRINGLPPGHYALQVRLQNSNSQWLSDVLILPLDVQGPVYQRWWFLLLTVLLLSGLGWAYFYGRTRRLLAEQLRLEAEVSRRTAQIEADKAVIERDKALIEQQAAELQASDTLKSRFFANVTHEFRTPLTLLLGPLTYLARRNTDQASGQLIASMERNARHLQRMVNELLDLSRLDAGLLQLVPQPTDLSALVNQTVLAFTVQAGFNRIDLRTSGTDYPEWVLLDGPKVETVLRNLLANALRFTPVGGQIDVAVTGRTDFLQLRVTDTGQGIHADDLPYIFDRYYQSRRPDTPLQGGTGIGLALCREYCRLWGGDVTVESQWGHGSTFSFTYPRLPLGAKVPAPRSTTSARLVKGTPHQPRTDMQPTADGVRDRLLLVEDNPDMRAYLQTLLSPHYTVQLASQGRQAWSWLAAQPAAQLPHLIVTDMMMPDMDGMTLVSRLQGEPLLRGGFRC